MEVIFVVLPLALVLAAIALGAFLWAVHRGQYDDLDTPALRVLFDDEDELDHPAQSHTPTSKPRQ